VSQIVLSNLTVDEVGDLIVKRIENVGGWGHEPFTDDAIDKIHEVTGGNPRDVIKLCDSAVTEATSRGILSVDGQVILQAGKNVQAPRVFKAKADAKDQLPDNKAAKPLDIKSVVEERINKLNKLYEEYVKAGDSDGVKEVVSIAESTVSESRKRLETGSVSPQEKERLSLMIVSFEKWLSKVGKNAP
jgi:hypothetical protein